MRVLLVHWALPPTVGGVENHLVDVATSLQAVGAQVAVVSGERRPSRGLFPPNVPLVYEACLDIRAGSRSGAAQPVRAAALERALRSFHPTVVHAHNLGRPCPPVTRALQGLKAELGYGLFHTSHSEWDGAPPVPDGCDWDGLLAPSAHLASRLARDGVGVLRLPVDATRFVPVRDILSTDEVRLLLPGRLIQEKGAHVAVLALRQLLARGINARLTLTDTPRILNFSNGTASAPLRGQELAPDLVRTGALLIRRPGWADMPTVFDDADIVVCPSLFDEPFGLGALEAMSCGRPLVVSDMGGLRALVDDRVTGLLVPTGDAGSLAEAVRELASSPWRARQMGLQGRLKALTDHAPAAHAAELVALYKPGRATTAEGTAA